MTDAERFRDTSLGNTGVSSDQPGGSGSSQGAGGVQESKEAVKETAQQTAQTAKDAAQQIATETQEQVQEVVSQTTEQVAQTVGQVREQATSAFVDQRDRVVETISGLAEALRETSRNLSDRSDQPGVGAVSPFIEEAAERLTQSADFLKQKDIGGLVSEAQQLARRQPAVFLGAMFAVGIAGARLLKGATGDDSGQSQSGSSGGSVGNSTSQSGMGSGYGSGMASGSSMGGSSMGSSSVGQSGSTDQSDYLLE
jgi:gas vesicle protein